MREINLKQIKLDNQMGVSYMKMEERDRLIRREGERKNFISLFLKKIRKGKSVEVIADELEEDLEVILPMYHTIQELGIDCDVEKIYIAFYENGD